MELFLFIALTHFIALLSPGPDFFLILMYLMKYGSNLTRYTVLGIALGNALILLLIFTLLWWLGQIHPLILQLLRWLGIAYLLYLAVQCFRYRDDGNESFTANAAIQTKTSRIICFVQGLQSSLLNPKNVMFYSSLILLVYHQFSFQQLFLICLWMVCVVLLWNLALLQLLIWKDSSHFLKKKSGLLYRVTGFCFVGFALMLAIF
ncbi:LysE family translocator [Acinetobacter kanungonis]|uniref:LysE family translocator n=1 Tax=Acinetobacter kanungonis TaxID=2699469 RepID=UPI00137B8F47|nr:LysE family translocator [Acinetobacter kanungonis]NCI77191.1 LysE family translocator [Acinetobacter kanungonis]